MPIIVGGIIEKDEKYLLIQEGRGRCKGLWNIPAGTLDAEELLVEGAVREIKEECGLDVKLTGICEVGGTSFPNDSFAMITFATEIIGGKIEVDGDEILDAKWFSYEEILEMKDQLRGEDGIIHRIKNIRNGIVAPMEIYINLKTNGKVLKSA